MKFMKNNMKRFSVKIIAGILFGLLVLNACGVVTKKYERPDFSEGLVDSLYRDTTVTDTLSIGDISWEEFFKDPKLLVLIDEALANNYDFQNAVLSIQAAENSLKQSKLAFLPSLDFSPSVTYNNTSQNSLNLPPSVNINLKTTNVSIGVSSSWELEIWGKMTAAKNKAYASFMKAESGKRAYQTSLISSVAESYFTLMALDKQLEITLRTIDLRKETVNTLSSLLEAGTITRADLVQAESNLYAAEIQVPELRRSIRELENALCVLLGKPFQAIDRSKLDEVDLSRELMVGVPVRLLQNRPDVMEAEWAFREAFEQTNVAKASFYPSITLTSGTFGISALTTRTLLDPKSIFANIVGGLTQPLFQRGKLKANHRNALLAQQQAFNNFEKSMLVAGQEVTDALFAYKTIEEKEVIREKQIEALQNAVTFRMKLLEFTSSTNYTDVLTSEQALLGAQIEEISDELSKYKAMIHLYRALGGGWK